MATILFSLIGSCLQKIQEITTEEAVLILGVKGELTDLQRRMKQIQCFINDAEQRSRQDSAVNNWVGELRDAMYDADNIIDLARFKGSKLLPDNPSLSSRKSTACSGCSPLSCFANMQTRREIAIQIKDLNKRIEKISKDDIFLTLKNTAPTGEVSVPHWRKTCPLVEPNLVGKEIIYSSRRLVDLVLAHKENKAYKLAIVGTGGVGKTTLAQIIYNDQKIKGNFSNQAWICVSQNRTEVSLLQEVLRNFGVHHEQSETIAELSSKLAAAIQDSSFFLVLDNVWRHEVWTNLLRIPLHAAATGIILVTTRHDAVAEAIGVEYVHRVELMSAEVGWDLLRKIMNIPDKEEKNLQNIGYDIVRKCGGLPLAIKVIASVLRTKEKTENDWRLFINSSAWSMGNLPTELSGALYSSYDDLPQHLKQCFLNCALYPEDWYMECKDLVRYWVAEGFVEKHKDQLLEDTAEEYYYELINRNLLQPDPLQFGQDKCSMHDLLRQLAHHLSREESFCGDPQSMDAQTFSKLRRVAVVTEKDSITFPGLDKEKIRARTLLIISGKQPIVDNTIFRKLSCIRVLKLTGSCIQSIPDSVGNLIHLRLLDLDGTDISCLPESIGSLMNLQTLNLQRCEALHSLPLAITQLSNLRRLGLAGTPINEVPKGIGRLELLNDLEGFPIGGGSDNGKTQDGWKLEELGQFSRLRRLRMIKLERAAPCSTGSFLIDKRYLKVLNLFCTVSTNESYSEEDVSNIEKIFDQLIPPENLEDLCIFGFFGRRYPNWLRTHLPSVKYLILAYCNSCVHLPPVGQLPNLKYLKIHRAATVTKIGPEFLGCGESNLRSTEAVAFPKLESLHIEDMPNLEEWCFVEEEDAAAAETTEGGEDGSPWLLPRLKKLGLKDCPKLRALPRHLGKQATNLKELQIREARCLKVVEDLSFLCEELVIVGCEDLERVSNLPQVKRLLVGRCPNLRSDALEGLASLQQVVLEEDMAEIWFVWIIERELDKAVDVYFLNKKAVDV